MAKHTGGKKGKFRLVPRSRLGGDQTTPCCHPMTWKFLSCAIQQKQRAALSAMVCTMNSGCQELGLLQGVGYGHYGVLFVRPECSVMTS